MDRRRTAIISLTAIAAVAASSALLLGVPTGATMVATDEAAPVAQTHTDSFYGTTVTLPNDYAAFYLTDGALQSRGDTSKLSDETLAGIEQQLAAAPANSVVFVDLDSLSSDGLTTVLTTVTPTNGMSIASSNEEMQVWLTGLFPGTEGTVASLPIPNVANASFTRTVTSGETSWQVTDYIFQYGDATVSATLSTTDTTGATRTEVDAMLASMTR